MSDASTPARQRLVVGRVRGLHGLQGTVRVEVLTDRPEDRFAPGRVLHPEGAATALTIVSAAPVEDGPGWRLRFREVPNRTAAERLRDRYLEIDVDRASGLEPGAVFWHEVIGAEVVGLAGTSLGHVADVYRAGEAEVYVVRGGPLGEFDLPAIRDVIREFAPADGRIVVDEAVLDLGSAPVDQAPQRAERRRPRWSRHGKGGGAGSSGRGPGPGSASAGPEDA